MPNAFTEERKGIVNVLSTKCGVSEAISVEELKKGAVHPKVLEVTAIWDTGALIILLCSIFCKSNKKYLIFELRL